MNKLSRQDAESFSDLQPPSETSIYLYLDTICACSVYYEVTQLQVYKCGQLFLSSVNASILYTYIQERQIQIILNIVLTLISINLCFVYFTKHMSNTVILYFIFEQVLSQKYFYQL